MSLVIDIHALQSLPPSNVNRDDTGAPKTAIFGGVPRQRVSSQSWKRAIRKEFERTLDPEMIGFRTKRIVDLIAERIVEISKESEKSWDLDAARTAAEGVFKAAGIALTAPKNREGESPRGKESGYLVFLSAKQIDHAARFLIDHEGKAPSKKEAKGLLDSSHSVDIAMFGRMLADAADYNVDAAVQVAHAIGVHESEPEFDYYTAVDDIVEDEEETGAGMIGTMQMMSSTLYRFATIDMESLTANLGDAEVAKEAALAFIRAFVTSMPTGKQNSYANNTLPELVYVAIRDSRSISLVNAFEQPVSVGAGESRRVEASKRLVAEEQQIEKQMGFVPTHSFVCGLDDLRAPFEDIAEAAPLPELIARVGEQLPGGDHA